MEMPKDVRQLFEQIEQHDRFHELDAQDTADFYHDFCYYLRFGHTWDLRWRNQWKEFYLNEEDESKEESV